MARPTGGDRSHLLHPLAPLSEGKKGPKSAIFCKVLDFCCPKMHFCSLDAPHKKFWCFHRLLDGYICFLVCLEQCLVFKNAFVLRHEYFHNIYIFLLQNQNKKAGLTHICKMAAEVCLQFCIIY